MEMKECRLGGKRGDYLLYFAGQTTASSTGNVLKHYGREKSHVLRCKRKEGLLIRHLRFSSLREGQSG